MHDAGAQSVTLAATFRILTFEHGRARSASNLSRIVATVVRHDQ